MDPENIEITINIVQGQQGAEFDQSNLQVPRGAFTVWMMRQVSSQTPPPTARTFRWRLQSNTGAHITITTVDSVSDGVS